MERSIISLHDHYNILTTFLIKKNSLKKQKSIHDETDTEEYITSDEEMKGIKERSKSISFKRLSTLKSESDCWGKKARVSFKIKKENYLDLSEENAVENNYRNHLHLFQNFSG